MPLQASIARLTELVKDNECTIESDEAAQLIDDLQTLLESALGEDSESVPQGSPAKRGYQYNTTVSDIFKELRLTQSLIQSAPAIAINERSMLQSVLHAKPMASDAIQEYPTWSVLFRLVCCLISIESGRRLILAAEL